MSPTPTPTTGVPRATWIGFALITGVLVATATGLLSAAGGVKVPLAIPGRRQRRRGRRQPVHQPGPLRHRRRRIGPDGGPTAQLRMLRGQHAVFRDGFGTR